MAIGYGVDQPRTTFSDTNLAKKVIQDSILLIDTMETPFIKAFPPGSAEEKFNITLNGKEVILIEDAHRQQSGVLSATATSDSTGLAVSDASHFKIGDVILIDAEIAWVSALATATNITVTRAVAGTQATHATGTITIVTDGQVEGKTADFGPTTSVNQPSNYKQLFEDSVKVTTSQSVLAQWGVTDELQRQRDKKVKELLVHLEKACTYEVSLRSAGSATTPGFMGSLKYFITTDGNYASTTGAITKALIDARMLACYNDGYAPDTLLANPSTIQNVLDILASTTTLKITQQEVQLGMQVESIQTQWGKLKLLASRHVNKMYAWFLSSDMVGTYEYYPWSERDLGVTGLTDAKQIWGEFSLLVAAGDVAHASLYTTATTGL